jgi:hypothetical protein
MLSQSIPKENPTNRNHQLPVNSKRLLYNADMNFCRIHKSLRVTPAMEAGVANHQWQIEELLA